MKILAIESATESASCALTQDGKVVAEFTLQNKQTHSQTLLPMIDAMCTMTGTRPEDLDVVAVSRGPGSFTGLRIGAATGKGIALPFDTKMASVPTLYGMACAIREAADRLIVPVIDARRQHVYAAGYSAGKDGTLVEELGECVISASTLAGKLQTLGKPVLLTGDGAKAVLPALLEAGLDVRVCPPSLCYARAAGVALAAEGMAARGELISSDVMAPEYLRLSQAERKRREAQNPAGQPAENPKESPTGKEA
jgi:tRNA threonylcarbamoyladenosine biosynthesis protein TsaB